MLWIQKTTGLCHIDWVIYTTDKKDLESSNKHSVFSNLSIYYAWKNVKGLYENSNLRIWRQTWDKRFEWPQ